MGLKSNATSWLSPPAYLVNNAAGAILAARALSLDPEYVRERLKTFRGMVRRFDIFESPGGGVVITDYGHSPEAINHILSEVRQFYPGRPVHLVFQPHLYSRTLAFFDDFVAALSEADRVSLFDIYPARERPAEWAHRVSSQELHEALLDRKMDSNFLGDHRDWVQQASGFITEEAVTVFMGAGDMDESYQTLFRNQGITPWKS
jgi:UDP-N-acetylmuramate--alanine ligase